MGSERRHLRFFVSSPGDVAEERAIAQRVIEQDLQKDPLLRDRFSFEVVRHDDPAAPQPMLATESPQQTLVRTMTRPAQCDVVIVILWSRLGSPLAEEEFRKADGSRYESGTEQEFESAIQAVPTPHVLVYHRTSPPDLVPGRADFAEKIEQLGRLNAFLARFDRERGAYRRGLNTYAAPPQFGERLAGDLKNYLRDLLRAGAAGGAPRPIPGPPYAEIARALGAGEMVPFIGPGVMVSHPAPGEPAGGPTFLPSSAELSRLLADEAGLPSEADREHLTEVASYYEATRTRVLLRQRLREVFSPEAMQSAAIPPLYAALAAIERPLLLVTTNYDTLLERAFLEAERRYDIVVYPADSKEHANAVLWWQHGKPAPLTPTPNELKVDPQTTTVIFKMHGTIAREGEGGVATVITESDFVDFLSRVGAQSAIPAVLSEHLRDRSVLFVGFDLRDWASRTILRRIKWRKGDDDDETPSWAVAEHFTTMELVLWERRGVHPVQVELGTFARELARRLAP